MVKPNPTDYLDFRFAFSHTKDYRHTHRVHELVIHQTINFFMPVRNLKQNNNEKIDDNQRFIGWSQTRN